MGKRYDAKEVGQWPRSKRLVGLKEHFSLDWSEAIRVTSDAKTGSGYAASLVINKLKPNLVLDIGCGNNVMKQYIDNLVGIDLLPWNGNTDIIGDVMDVLKLFKNDSVDAIRSVGPFNFGTEKEIIELILECKRVLRPGGLCCSHARPGRKTDETHFQQRGMIHHPWTRDEIHRLTDVLDLELLNPNPSVPDLNQDIITETTDMKQVSWPVLESYCTRFNSETSTVDDWNQWVNRHMDDDNILDPTESYESMESILIICMNEKYRRLKDNRYNSSIPSGVRPRYNWWWRKK
jgi:SAM-dependent methyltransferase